MYGHVLAMFVIEVTYLFVALRSTQLVSCQQLLDFLNDGFRRVPVYFYVTRILINKQFKYLYNVQLLLYQGM